MSGLLTVPIPFNIGLYSYSKLYCNVCQYFTLSGRGPIHKRCQNFANSIHSEPTFALVLASFPDVWRPDPYKRKLKLGC